MTSIASQLWEAAGAPLLDEIHGVTVTYWRGLRSVTVTAIPSVIDYEAYSQDDGILTTIARMRQYLIRADELVIDGRVVDPQLRDRITETINGTSYTYEVGPISGKPLAEQQSAGGERWLIRTKRVG